MGTDRLSALGVAFCARSAEVSMDLLTLFILLLIVLVLILLAQFMGKHRIPF